MMTGQEYLESIRNMKMHIFCMGEELETAVGHPILQPSLNSVRMTYDLAQDPEYRELMTASSHLTGRTINRFTNLHQSCQDLINKVKNAAYSRTENSFLFPALRRHGCHECRIQHCLRY